ncbi:jg17090 [Pararge aegeria aegeria]|uniref:Jg17090 protein n=1 Tax=Pararge aegeria aegeria TaxID=348720 RepID=A0A8S4R0P2_9NEOP|nr:jg17090 [Pararge aegeria aegeria]
MVLDEKNLEPRESNASFSNIVEINFNLKFKQPDKTETNIKKDTQNEKAGSKATLQKSVQDVLQDKTKQSINRIEDPEKRDVNIKIVINSYQQNPNKSKRNLTNFNLHTKDDFTRKISEKFHTVSTGYSDVLDLQTYSIHKTTVNFSDSTDTSKHDIKPSEEIIIKELAGKSPLHSTDVESLTIHSTFECSASSSAVNNTEVLPSDISRITGVSGTDNGEASLLVVEKSNLEVPKVRNKEEKKIILKQIFENSNDTKNTGNKIKMRSKMLGAVFTSDSSSGDDVKVNHVLAKELTYQSLKPNYFKYTDSMTNYYQHGSMSDNRPSKNCINEILFPAERINSTDTVSSNVKQNLQRLRNHLATTLNTRAFENKALKTCCCRGVDKRDQEVDCNLTKKSLKFNKTDYVDVQTQYSYLKGKNNKSVVKIPSNKNGIPSLRKVCNKISKRVISNVNACPLNKLNRLTLLGLSDDDKVIILNAESDLQPQMKTTNRSSNGLELKPIDILQLHETKKAVLEIYAESIGEGLIARLPKFVYNKEKEIYNYYQEMVRFSSNQYKKYR